MYSHVKSYPITNSANSEAIIKYLSPHMSKRAKKSSSKQDKESNPLPTPESSQKLYENTSPIGLKPSASLPKVRFQKGISIKKKSKFQVFNRYLQFKFGGLPEQEEVPQLPIKRKESSYFQRNLYDLLKLEPGCDKNAIKGSYRKLAAVHHPDKGGDPLYFRCLNQAYEILCNDEVKAIYDDNGFKGIKAISDIDTAELEKFILNYNTF